MGQNLLVHHLGLIDLSDHSLQLLFGKLPGIGHKNTFMNAAGQHKVIAVQKSADMGKYMGIQKHRGAEILFFIGKDIHRLPLLKTKGQKIILPGHLPDQLLHPLKRKGQSAAGIFMCILIYFLQLDPQVSR